MAGSMEDQLVQLLKDTQSAATTKQAEAHLLELQAHPEFPTSLSSIASHTFVPSNIRQAALSVLRTFVQSAWSGQPEDDHVGPLPEIHAAARHQIRQQMLELATSDEDDRKVKSAASYVVSKIASVDFPDEWPTLLPTLLQMIPTATDGQLHGALKVLSDLVEDSLNEDQFFSVARDIVKVVYDVAVNDARRETLRALAVSVFRGCFDIMDLVKDEHGPEVKGFADEALTAWSPFFLSVMKMTLPVSTEIDVKGGGYQPESWRGLIALKLQVVKTLVKIRAVFPQLLVQQSTVFFSATWEELSVLQKAYEDMYINDDKQGRLEDADGLPYTLDFLILEELDFLQSCLRAPPVQKELEGQIQANASVQTTPWVLDVMKLAVGYAQIPNEEEGLWDIDVNLFLAEETSVTANYTARTACGDLLIKLAEWLNQGALEGLLAYTKILFANESGGAWRAREASLYLLTQLLNDFLDVNKTTSSEIVQAYLEFIDYAIQRQDESLLRARGYLAAGVLVQSIPPGTFQVVGLVDQAIRAIKEDEFEVVKVACIKAVQGFIEAQVVPIERQLPIAAAISDFLHSKDLTELEDADDLLVTMVESLRDTINMDPQVCLAPGSGSLDLLFVMAKHGASNFQVTMLVNETFEEIVEAITKIGNEAYSTLCSKVLPSLTGAFDVGDMTQDEPLTCVSQALAFPKLMSSTHHDARYFLFRA